MQKQLKQVISEYKRIDEEYNVYDNYRSLKLKRFILVFDENKPKMTESFTVSLMAKKDVDGKNISPKIHIRSDLDANKYFDVYYDNYENAKTTFDRVTSGEDEIVRYVILNKIDVSASSFVDLLKRFYEYSAIDKDSEEAQDEDQFNFEPTPDETTEAPQSEKPEAKLPA